MTLKTHSLTSRVLGIRTKYLHGQTEKFYFSHKNTTFVTWTNAILNEVTLSSEVGSKFQCHFQSKWQTGVLIIDVNAYLT